jgi:hypothetical protein
MTQFTEFSKEDQRMICEAMSINNEMMLNPMIGEVPPTSEDFRNCIKNMSMEATEYRIEELKKGLPEKYR